MAKLLLKHVYKIYPPIDADSLELTVKAEHCIYQRADILLHK